MNSSLVVWDVDGTLVDSRRAIFEAMQGAYDALGLPPPIYDAVRQVVGLELREALSVLLPHLPGPELDAGVAAYKAAYQAMLVQPGFSQPLYDGAADTLERLRSRGWKIAMATGKSRRGVESVIRAYGWDGVFDSTHCSDDGPGKPDPAMLLEAMRHAGCGPDRTIMVGDTAHDMRMAKCADVYAQGVSWGFHTADEVRAAGAHHVAQDFLTLNSQLEMFSEGLLSPR